MELWQLFFINANPEDPTWKALHEDNVKHFTASTIPDILGYGYNSCAKRYDLMTGQKPVNAERQSNEFLDRLLKWGNDMEPKAISHFLSKYHNFRAIKPGMMYYRKGNETQYPILASTDAILMNVLNEDEFALLEIKCPYQPKDLEEFHDIPVNWLIQMMVEMACFKINGCILHVYQPSEDKQLPESYTFGMEYSQQVMDMIVNELDEFTRVNINQKQRPTRKTKSKELARKLRDLLVKF